MRGHVTPAAYAGEVGPADAALGAVLADGRHLARCLRCDTWIEHSPPIGADVHYAKLPPLSELTKPRRGKPLAEAIVMRLIAINKGTHAFAFTLLAIAALALQTNLTRIHSFAERVLRGITGPLNDTGQYANKTWLGRQLEHLLNLKAGTLKVLLLVAVLYAVLEWTEAIGLWFEKRWAEYLTVVATAGLLPLEIRELLHRVTVFRLLAFVVNVALLIWLVYAKRLFGVRGGPHAMHEEIDWDAIVASPTPALGRRPRAGQALPRPPMLEPIDLPES